MPKNLHRTKRDVFVLNTVDADVSVTSGDLNVSNLVNDSILWSVTGQSLNSSNYTTAITVSSDIIIDSMVLVFSGGSYDQQVSLEDDDTGGVIFRHDFSLDGASYFTVTNINQAFDSTQTLYLSILQKASISVTGNLIARTA